MVLVHIQGGRRRTVWGMLLIIAENEEMMYLPPVSASGGQCATVTPGDTGLGPSWFGHSTLPSDYMSHCTLLRYPEAR